MPHYLIQAAYTSDAWATMIKNPADRGAALGKLVEKLGGKVQAFYFCFGEYDVVSIVELPDNGASVSAALAAVAAGHLKNLRTTPLLTNEETMKAMKKAGTLSYAPPK